MAQWDEGANEQSIQVTVSSLEKNGVTVFVVSNGPEAKQKVLALVPKGAEVMTMTSTTLDTIGVTEAINSSGQFDAVMPKLYAMDRKTQGRDMQKLGSAPEWTIGSVHAVTEDGHVLIASNSGSQLPAYAYSAAHVIWVVGAQKIVKNVVEGMKRIYEYCLPLEDIRAQKAYGVGSAVNKLLIVNAETVPGRIIIILVKEKLGF